MGDDFRLGQIYGGETFRKDFQSRPSGMTVIKNESIYEKKIGNNVKDVRNIKTINTLQNKERVLVIETRPSPIKKRPFRRCRLRYGSCIILVIPKV